MRIIENSDKSVSKFLHNDGSETTIKITPSQEYLPDKSRGFIRSSVDRNKYSVIISSSIGCKMDCKFCGITNDSFEFLYPDEIINNVKHAISEFRGDLSSKYIKLCFMGMGEASLVSSNFNEVPKKILKWVIENKYAIGVDSVDYGTILPFNRCADFVKRLKDLNNYIEKEYELNSLNNHNSAVRVFYSLHSTDESIRKRLIPNSNCDITDLYRIAGSGIDVILHCTFIENQNDSLVELRNLADFMDDNLQFQLRLLRYNNNGVYKESKNWEIIWDLLKHTRDIKYQISPGKEVRGACGQFY